MNKERLYEKLNDYKNASKRLDEATKLEALNDIVYDGVIQRFEFTFELSWKLMKSFLEYMGITDLRSPRATIREAYAYGLIEDGDKWIDMLVDRNKTSHLYDEEEVRMIYDKIINEYNDLLLQIVEVIESEIKNVK